MSAIQTQVVSLRSTTTNLGWAAIAADGSPIGFTSNVGNYEYKAASLTSIPVASDDASGISSTIFTINNLNNLVYLTQDVEMVNGEAVVSIEPVFVVGSEFIVPTLADESKAVTRLADGSTLTTVFQTIGGDDVATTGGSRITVKIRVSSDGKVLSESARIIPAISTAKQASI